ncbi:hypothetical protein KKI24_22645 [bacterium]|nr:hypothetical protein [bacterium]
MALIKKDSSTIIAACQRAHVFWEKKNGMSERLKAEHALKIESLALQSDSVWIDQDDYTLLSGFMAEGEE